jgi:hypothetical protein
LTSSLGRSGAGASATQVLREQLARTEDLAVLVPQLEAVRARIDADAGPDQTEAMQRLRRMVDAAERRHGDRQSTEQIPTRWTAADARALAEAEGKLAVRNRRWWRPDREGAAALLRIRIDGLRQRRDGREGRPEPTPVVPLGPPSPFAELLQEAEAAEDRRARWIQRHPDEVRWESELAERVAARRRALAALVETHPPDRIVRMLGPRPAQAGSQRQHWLDLAERVEAHHERWRLPQAPFGRTGAGRAQQMWETKMLERDLDRWTRQRRSIQRGLGRDLDAGLGR